MNALELLLQTPPMRALGWTLVHFVWQGVALYIVHEILQLVLLKHSASARYVASCFILFAMLAAAGLTLRLEMQRSPVGIGNILAQTTPLGSPMKSTSDESAREGATPHAAAAKVSDPHFSHPSDVHAASQVVDGGLSRFRTWGAKPLNILHARAPRLEELLPWLVSLWWAGVFLLSTRLAIGWQEARWLRNRALRPLLPSTLERCHALRRQLEISRPVKIVESALAEVPTVIGWLRPVVLLPTAAITGLSPHHLEALIAHELTHVKRHDYLVNLLQTMIETLLFYHPAVWWVSNRIRDERENCCDDVAVRVCGNAVLYARALTNMEELRGGVSRPELAMAADGGSLVQRVRRLVGRGGEPTTPGAGVVVGAVLVALSSLLAVSAGRTTESASSGQANTDVTILETQHLGGKIAGIQEAQPAPQLPDPGAVSDADKTSSESRVASPEPVRPRPSSAPRPPAKPDVRSNPRQDALGPLTADQCIGLLVVGVDAHEVEELRHMGMESPDPELLIHMYSLGLSADVIDTILDDEMEDVSVETLLLFKELGLEDVFLEEFRRRNP